MKIQWDYTQYAKSYINRPGYAENTVQEIINYTGLRSGDLVCDIGAGAAHLTLLLARHGFNIQAIEPNNEMRKLGIMRTENYSNVSWSIGTGEESNEPDNKYHMVTFGSSFNVCRQDKALEETWRILRPNGYLCCLWNHRDIHDSIQNEIENIIKEVISDYSYGSRRMDPTENILKSALFDNIIQLKLHVTHEQSIKDCIQAWYSHATLGRQAGEKFNYIVEKIYKYLLSLNVEKISIPYDTRIYIFKVIKR